MGQQLFVKTKRGTTALLVSAFFFPIWILLLELQPSFMHTHSSIPSYYLFLFYLSMMKAGILTNRAINNLNVQMVFLHLESLTSQWHHLVRGVEYYEPWRFSLASWASFHFISASVFYSVCKIEQSSCDYLLSQINSLRNQLRSLLFASCNHGIWKIYLNLRTCPWDLNLVIDWQLKISAPRLG